MIQQKSLLLIGTFLFFCFSIQAQVTSVNYKLKYQCEENIYGVYLVVNSGSATTIPQRAQFNSQITMVWPSGLQYELLASYNPLRNNQQYTSEEPMNWSFAGFYGSPQASPNFDYLVITPELTPASFYNDLFTGDEVLLFEIRIGEDEYNDEIRFFESDIDPNIDELNGADIRNGFTLGSPVQIYSGYETESCEVTDVEENTVENITIYPNPAYDYINISGVSTNEIYTIHDYNGVFVSQGVLSNSVIDITNLSSGKYSVQFGEENDIKSIPFIKY